MYFAAPKYFAFFFLLIPFIAIWIWSKIKQRKRMKQFASSHLLSSLQPNSSPKRRTLINILYLLTFSLIVCTLARPQIKKKGDQPEQNKGIEAIIALDISNSMLAEDLKPNRLNFAKMVINKLVTLQANSKFGVIVFAGGAYLQIPLTTDLDIVHTFIQNADPTIISNQGSAIGSAIKLALPSFSEQKDIGKCVLIFTDGEDHEGDAVEMAKKAEENGVRIFTIATGTDKGAPIPLSSIQDISKQSRGQAKYLTDESGHMVVSKANFKMCQEIAEAGDGKAFSSSNITTITKGLNKELKQLPQGNISNQEKGIHELFAWFALFAILILVILELIFQGKNPFFRRFNLFE